MPILLTVRGIVVLASASGSASVFICDCAHPCVCLMCGRLFEWFLCRHVAAGALAALSRGRYTVLLDGLTASSSCNCEKFQYGMCPHLTPEAMLCDLYQICYDHKEYQAKYCAGDVRALPHGLPRNAPKGQQAGLKRVWWHVLMC